MLTQKTQTNKQKHEKKTQHAGYLPKTFINIVKTRNKHASILLLFILLEKI